MDRQMSSEELRELVLGILVRREAYGVEIAAALASRLPSRSEDADLPEGPSTLPSGGSSATGWP